MLYFWGVTPVFSVKDTAAVERDNVLMWIVGHKIILVTAWDRCRRIYVRAGQWDHSFVICGVLCNPRSIHWTMHCDEMLLFTFRWSQSEKRSPQKSAQLGDNWSNVNQQRKMLLTVDKPWVLFTGFSTYAWDLSTWRKLSLYPFFECVEYFSLHLVMASP